MKRVLDAARGSLLGAFAGDALGAQVEFCSTAEIAQRWPDGVHTMCHGGTWQTLPGQLTDDGEMARMLASSLVSCQTFDADDVRKRYCSWLTSAPFDCGNTIYAGLMGRPNVDSQANGALMRAAPLGIFGSGFETATVMAWAREDALLTHPHPICLWVNALYVAAIAWAIRQGVNGRTLFKKIAAWAAMDGCPPLLREIIDAAHKPPRDFLNKQGWVLIAFQNCLFHLQQETPLAEALIWTVGQGGDTDTNAAILGGVLGAVQGAQAIPDQWQNALLTCRPQAGLPQVHRPRPVEFWPIDALALADALVRASK